MEEETMKSLRPPDVGRHIWALGALVSGKVLGEETEGRFELIEHTGPQGYAAPLHTHIEEAEAFYVVEGQLTMVIGEEESEATAGTFAFLSPGQPHAFRVDSPTARFHMLVSPARLMPFFEELGEVAFSATLPPPPDGPPDADRLARLAAKHGMEILGPPPGAH